MRIRTSAFHPEVERTIDSPLLTVELFNFGLGSVLSCFSSLIEEVGAVRI